MREKQRSQCTSKALGVINISSISKSSKRWIMEKALGYGKDLISDS